MLIELPELNLYQERYETIETQPLRIHLHLVHNSQLAGYDPVALDNLLARAVLMEATGGQTMLDSKRVYVLPVPLKRLWQSPEGLPLWAATQFWPEGVAVSDIVYWHKRVQRGEFTGTKTGKLSIKSTDGRWMERRVPLPVKAACDHWCAECIGNPEEIARLLSTISHVGKRRSNGFGEVERWEIEEIAEFGLLREGVLTRPMIAEALPELLPGVRFAEEPAPVGWTPPQWKPDLFRPGWWSGTEAMCE